jgi:CheY-like chemotaxis protein
MDEAAGRYRILIVDYRRHCSATLSHLVRLLGCEVRVAHDGAEALKASTEYRPDWVFIAIGLLEEDGYEVARYIRDQPWSTGICMIAMTAAGQQVDERRLREAGFDHHLAKPIDVQALLSIIGQRRGRCPAGSPAVTVISVKTTARRNIDNYPIRFRYS